MLSLDFVEYFVKDLGRRLKLLSPEAGISLQNVSEALLIGSHELAPDEISSL